MSAAPSVLLLDDGELGRVQRILEGLQADFVRLKGREIGRFVDQPRDLLITSARRAANMPRVEALGDESATPIWACLHNQDFLPLRERLRELGVHFLIHSAIGQEPLRLFLLQLLYRGAERRSCLRLPLGGDVSYQLGSRKHTAKLAELSRDMCRILATEPVAPGAVVSVLLPAALGGGNELELQAIAIRSVECESRPGQSSYSVVLKLDSLERGVRKQLEALVSGKLIGTRVTPLAEVSDSRRGAGQSATSRGVDEASVSDQAPNAGAERRRQPRREYRRRVDVITDMENEAPELVFGYDLSVGGVRIEGHSGVGLGTQLTLALYGGRREEPVLIDATVVRDHGERGIGLRFESVTPQQLRQLEKLSVGLPSLQSLDEEQDDPRVLVSRVMSRLAS